MPLWEGEKVERKRRIFDPMDENHGTGLVNCEIINRDLHAIGLMVSTAAADVDADLL